jgi:hypothetical protein
MSRRWLLSLICLSIVSFLFVQNTSARFELSVDETATVISLKELAPELSLATFNGTGKPLDASVRVEFIDPSDTVVSTLSQNVTINTGRQKLNLTLPFRTRDFSPNENHKILWYRLRYVITPLQSTRVEPVRGIVSISEITPELFELRVTKPGYVREGMRCRALVTTLHPITRKPVQGVELKGLIKIDKSNTRSERRVTASTITNSDGFAYLDFNLPSDIEKSDMELVVDATHGLLAADASEEIDLSDQLSFIVSTDKPIYQPGQTVFSRILVIDSARRVVSGLPVSLHVRDEDREILFSAELETSRFGIAASEWVIPESAKLGDYELEFETNDTGYSSRVKVSRYELPNFAVKVDLDHDYYLAGQNASVTVKADYLFGKPVSRGHVKVVRETKREWNYREQRYDIEEGDKYEGEVGSDGLFKTGIDLSHDHDSLEDDERDSYHNITYTAYFTDSSTNRTEQKRFDLRITKQPIHLYVNFRDNSYGGSQGLPLRFYLSTFYADGTPASCNVEVFSLEEDDDTEEHKVRIGNIKTNKYGLAKIDNWRLPEFKETDSNLTLDFVAIDKDGKTGHHQANIYSDNDPEVRVTTAKSIFAPGEAIKARVSLTEPNSLVTISLVRDWTLLHSQIVRASSHDFPVVVPYKPEFKGELTLVASVVEGSEVKTSANRTILFPQNRDLQLKVEAGAQTYLPGDQASVKFQAVNAAGRMVESALGVVVVDQAIQERFSTDVEYERGYVQFNRDARDFIGYNSGIGPISRRSLDQLDPTKRIAPELDLVAEILLNNREAYRPSFFSSEYAEQVSWVFSTLLTASLKPVRTGLEMIYEKRGLYPSNESTLRQLLTGIGIDFDSIPDPWGNHYRPEFSIQGPFEVLDITSAGPDKRWGTPDDFKATSMHWKYFDLTGLQINRAVDEYHKRTGDYLRDYKMLRDELWRSKIDPDTIRDRWGKPYKFNFEITGKYYSLSVTTISPTPLRSYYGYGNREFEVWRHQTNYFAEYESKIDSALASHSLRAKEPPTNVSDLDQVLKAAGIDLSLIRDPWGSNYYQTFSLTSFYADKTTVTTIPGRTEPIKRVDIKPVTRRMAVINFRSAGLDKTEGNADDFTVATFYSIASEQAATDIEPVKPRVVTTSTGYNAVITGTVLDPHGAVITGATITVTRDVGTNSVETQSDSEGRFVLRNLEAGVYELRVQASGFQSMIISSIVVRSSTSVQVEVVLKVGEVFGTVTVASGEADMTMETTAASVTSQKVFYRTASTQSALQLSTPRVRGHFPETLLWQPELTTDKTGRAQLDFKLADNITTWKLSVIGSTADGELGVAETDIRAFQPFFADLDPPRVLTEGDRISLPVVLRNYLDRKQRVELELKPENWFSVISSNRQTIEVPAGDSKTPTFDLKAIASIKDGKQRAIARGPAYSDAIEKPVTVHPDGEEIAVSQGDLLSDTGSIQVDLPPDVIAGSARTELKVYPNLMGHVWESVEGIMQRPFGCAEQTISSAYPSLLVLRYLKKEDRETPLARKARGYLELGYQRLLTYQRSDGSFGYWVSSDGADAALTAYAIRFLQDATSVLTVNPNILARANEWLIKQQQTDGRWRSLNWKGEEQPRGSALLTALIARSLASQLRGKNTSTPATAALQESLKSSFSYLDRRSKEIDEPYLIASYALAASLAGEQARAEENAVRLQALAHSERTGSYWSLETNTPFYGWGMTGRIETTALVVNALAGIKAANEADDLKRRDLQSRGLLFLIKNKDQYGCWYSTQATINVLDAMLSLLGERSTSGPRDPEVMVFVNGVQRGSLNLPNSNQASALLTMDLSPFVQGGPSRIELRRAGGGPVASVQSVTTYYVPWKQAASSEQTGQQVNNERLTLQTVFDKTSSGVMEEITCRVKAERIGFSGYGMLLAEIGLPPGADVDRGSLEAAKAGSEWSIGRYDVLPDRIVLYLWPRAGGTEFTFKFKPRLGMTAKSTASTIYDYYNPEARAVVAPSTFTVR